MTNRFLFLLVGFVLIHSLLSAQSDSIKTKEPGLQFSGLVDVFYVYDLNKPGTNYRQTFLANYNRHNEFNINIAMMRMALDRSKYRAHLALQAGTYPADNYAAEQPLLRNVYEANAGISLNEKNSLWLDAGIFPSYIGFESPLAFDNWTLTRSLLADASPYYMTGAKVTYTPSSHWLLMAMVNNGWQRIQRVAGNSLPGFGTQVKYTSANGLLFNWSTFIGTDDPDVTRRMRYFNNFFAQFQLTDRLQAIAGVDVGAQQTTKGSSTVQWWYAPVGILQYKLSDKWLSAYRLEYYADKSGVIIPTKTPNGFQTAGYSVNVDYVPSANVMCRIECRWLNSQDAVFLRDQVAMHHDDVFLSTSIAVKW